MNPISHELIQMVQTLDRCVALPKVKSLVIPPVREPAHGKYAKFGLLLLDDGSSGFFYRLLELESWIALDKRGDIKKYQRACENAAPAALAELLVADDQLSRGLGMAAINAVSQHVLKRINYQPPSVTRTPVEPGRHIGMVGYFEPMILALRKNNVQVSVLELDESLYQQDDGLLVTGDIERLAGCDTVYCTASTLLNDSLPGILKTLSEAQFELIGPTCSCLPDPLFAHGVDKIGSAWVVDTESAVGNIQALQPWGDTVKKYEITPTDYPGFDYVLDQLSARRTGSQ